MIGTTTAGFRIVTELGSGPTGEVYFAERLSDGERVAFKVLRPEACFSRDRLGAVLDEIQTVAALEAPGIARVVSAGALDDRAFVVSEMVDGVNLEERLANGGRIESREAADIAARIAEAVGALHEASHTHRGLKPANVFLRATGITVTDFGLTALLQEIELPVACLRYASPEQCRGDADVDHRTDIYSLGALLYHMLTGRPPFDAADPEHLAVAHATTEPTPPRALRQSIPEWMEAIVLRALAKQPDERFPSIQTMGAALREGLASPWDEDANKTQESEPPRKAASVHPRTEDGTEEMEVPPDPEEDLTGPVRLVDSSTPLEERERRAADQLAGHLLRRIIAGRIELPAAPESVTAFIRLVVDTRAEADPTEILESDEELRGLVGRHFENTVVVARLARDIAAESQDPVHPGLAYLTAFVLAAAKPLVTAAIPELEASLKEPDRSYVTPEVRAQVVDVCYREVAVSLTYAWQLPPEIAIAIPSIGRGDGAMGPPLAQVLSAAYESVTQLD